MMVWLFQPSAPGTEDARLLLMTSYSAGPFNSNGCKNAQAVVQAMAQASRVTAFTACLPQSIAKLDVVPPAEYEQKAPSVQPDKKS